MAQKTDLASLCRRIRYNIITSTTEAGSGHPTSCLSAVELMATLFFGGFFRQDIHQPHSPLNDKIVFSKGHAAPLLYALYETAEAIDQTDLLSLRQFGSPLQGHPTPNFLFADTATGSLGQGLSIGVGIALGIRQRIKNKELGIKREPTVWVLLGDSEMAEGQIWEAMEIASYYNLNNLIGIVDINRLGQTGETGLGWQTEQYKNRAEAFGWKTIAVKNGHNLSELQAAFENADRLNTVKSQKPTLIIAQTVKGKGISFLEDKEGLHGKVVPKERLPKALNELGIVDFNIKGTINKPKGTLTSFDAKEQAMLVRLEKIMYRKSATSDQRQATSHRQLTTNNHQPSTQYQPQSTREAFGTALEQLGKENNKIIVLDAETANSTYENKFAESWPERFFEMFIAEQNMLSVALGLATQGFIPFVSTFAAFLTRAFDQIRMIQYSYSAVDSAAALLPASARKRCARVGEPLRPRHLPHLQVPINISIIGSHAGVSIGADGPSQMGLEDIAMMRSIHASTVLYPSDAVSTAKLTNLMAHTAGIKYLRTTRGKTPIIYDENEEFHVGGLKIHEGNFKYQNSRLRQGYVGHGKKNNPKITALVIAAGITLHEALEAQKELEKKNIYITVVDLYSIKPLDSSLLRKLVKKTPNVIVVEDHYEAGGIGEAVLSALFSNYQPTIINTQSSYNNKIINKTLIIENCKIENFIHLCVRKTPCSGTPEELMRYEGINSNKIMKAVRHFNL